jgi:branched-chain amino acid transport system substrate-binding protein
VLRYTIEKHPRNARGARRRCLSLLAASLIVAATVALAGCGSSSSSSSSSDPAAAITASSSTAGGSKATPILFGAGETVIPGVYDAQSQLTPGFKAALGYINAHGGWGGRPVKIIPCTSPGDPASDTKCFHQFISDHVLATIGLLSTNGTIGLPLESKAGIPDFMSASSNVDDTSTWENDVSPGGTQAMTAPARYACAKGYKKVSVLMDDDSALKSEEAKFAASIYAKCGIDVSLIQVPPGTADPAPYIEKAVSSNPDLLYVDLLEPSITVVDDIASTNFPMSKVLIGPLASAAFFADPKTNGILIEGSYAIPGTTDPDLQLYRTALAKYSPGADVYGQLTLPGFRDLMVIWDAGKAIGFKNLTGPALEKYMNKTAPGKMTLFGGTKVALAPGSPGAKETYSLISRYNGKQFVDGAWYPSTSTCTSQANCASGVVTTTGS